MLANTNANQARILTADLTWEPVHSLNVGQQVVTFDASQTVDLLRVHAAESPSWRLCTESDSE